MTYLLDTCTVSDIVKGRPGVLARVKAMPPNLLAVSAPTRMEVNFGLALNAGRMKKLAQALDAFFSALATLPNPCQPSIPTCRHVWGVCCSICGFGAPETIRTSDPCLRRAVLYPTELRARGEGEA